MNNDERELGPSDFDGPDEYARYLFQRAAAHTSEFAAQAVNDANRNYAPAPNKGLVIGVPGTAAQKPARVVMSMRFELN